MQIFLRLNPNLLENEEGSVYSELGPRDVVRFLGYQWETIKSKVWVPDVMTRGKEENSDLTEKHWINLGNVGLIFYLESLNLAID